MLYASLSVFEIYIKEIMLFMTSFAQYYVLCLQDTSFKKKTFLFYIGV